MRTINYSFSTSNSYDVDHPECTKSLISKDYFPFRSLSKESAGQRKGVIFQKCPAHTDYTKNTFVFCAPFDITIDIDIDLKTGEGKIFCENISQEVFNQIVDTRFLFQKESGISPYPVIGIDWLCIFTTDEPMLMQVVPAFLHYNDFTAKTTIIPGEYDISKWTRPVETVFEIKSSKEKIIIKKGDAISYIKFLTTESIKLVEQSIPWNEIKICNDIRQSDRYRPLSARYEKLNELRKCPYEPKN